MKNNFDPEVDNSDNYKFTIFYYNTSDKRIIIPKRNKYLGWTLNFGNHFTFLLIISIISILLISSLFL